MQRIGIPMGCKCRPTVANLFLYTLEKSYLSLHPEMIYKRFIDDIFIISSYKIDQSDLCRRFGDLTLNIVESEKVNFLDLNIRYNRLVRKIQFSLYIKPTNTFSYLLSSSNHPNQTFKNIPVSLFIRIRRICSNYHDYLFYSSLLVTQLAKRGYNFKLVNQILLLLI